MMSAAKRVRIAADCALLAFAALVAWLSFTGQPAEAFLFPRVIAAVFLVLACANAIHSVFAAIGGDKGDRGDKGGDKGDDKGVSMRELKNMAPGAIILAIYVLAAKNWGFYASSALAFLAIYGFYDPADWRSGRAWAKRLFVAAVFMVVLYVLFALVLQVQTPKGEIAGWVLY